ncbi:kinase-like domain-containing protein [Jimgerdemannia flammicorona]|uniref:Kinase-like domain-containing protein n=1 Tax=Jimgerdemannia flammicorona TaxID=994334 RepID=A0A433QQT4_9FUNG|nr:kinase-like domain-containing protein [Jimgerdemannia flammicorona]
MSDQHEPPENPLEAVAAIEDIAKGVRNSGLHMEQLAKMAKNWQGQCMALALRAKQVTETIQQYIEAVKEQPETAGQKFDLKAGLEAFVGLKSGYYRLQSKRNLIVHISFNLTYYPQPAVIRDMTSWIQMQWHPQPLLSKPSFAAGQQLQTSQKLTDFNRRLDQSLAQLALAFTPHRVQRALDLVAQEQLLRQLKQGVEEELAALEEIRRAKLTPDQERTRWLELAIEHHHIRLIPYESLKVTKFLKKGGFGIVSTALWDDSDVVLKQLFDQKDFVDEVMLHTRVHDGDYIVKFHGVTKDPEGTLGMVMKYAHNGNLREYITSHGSVMSWYDRLRLAQQIATGLSFIHRERIFHRDFHSYWSNARLAQNDFIISTPSSSIQGNILIDLNGAPMITDFGLSRTESVALSEQSMTVYGIVAYTAPERLRTPSYRYDDCCDIYSLGVILWEISSVHRPFGGQNDIPLAFDIMSGVREHVVDGTPKKYAELYQACWDADPEKRPDITTVKKVLNELVEAFRDPKVVGEGVELVRVKEMRATAFDQEGAVTAIIDGESEGKSGREEKSAEFVTALAADGM